MPDPRKQPRPQAAPVAEAPPRPVAAVLLPTWLRTLHAYRGLLVPIGFVLLMAVLLVPLPPWLMDVLIVLNITLSVMILLTTIYMSEPLDFSVFPSLLLGVTLYRLVLNVASTRLILTADAPTPEEATTVAGHVIMAFGSFVAGDSLFVGVVIFMILVIVQFVVITKGATRISEVAARFTLDAMPGKQMAIDADLNAGVITETEARTRRDRISQEADFFGAMDGASKFVRGDAVAGLIITAINVFGGFAVGVLQRGWDAGRTAETFTQLTIGDGLSSQIPAFIVSIAAALIVTRSGSRADLDHSITDQVASQPRGLIITAAFLALMVLTPLPSLPLVGMAAVLGGLAFVMLRTRKKVAAESEKSTRAAKSDAAPAVEQLLKVDLLELELGYGLVGLVDKGQGGDLLDRITAIRRQLAAESGLVMPPVRIRDNVQLPPNEYRVKIRGNALARGHTRPGKLLAMDSGLASGSIEGEPTREPAFGLDARWIDPAYRSRAEALNYTVVDATSVVATHLTEVVRRHGDELLTRDEVNNLLENLKQRAPKLVEDVVPGVLKPHELQRILQNLLRERVPIRDLETILETLAEWAPRTKDMDVLTEYVRNSLRRTICGLYAQPLQPQAAGLGGGPAPAGEERTRLVCVTLDPSLEDLIGGYVERGPAGTTVSIPARLTARIAEQITKALQLVVMQGMPPVVIASPQVRGVVRQILAPHLPAAAVLGYNEIVDHVEVESLALVMPPPAEQPALRQPAAA
ncbi:MAG: flagellar biosynthesis protein FlhA [Phycisphaerae bacterium]|nr:flagellar biosynthesis protein FlhA [Phycisphaerae bacterium]